ncbi:uncharacterized protein B0I36DRAFT_362888 [Microdochium trichocladiopsis]|uniref:MARVEL domain-containing protein n=1 Tax=Microdochium trichocladiopsis TaxID=1682393 RepID=A0A9P8Y6G5_9PEZI|nr:uncharacterized protein B0I36DRAFT_362888 [Microdochium trichocladiopsis]KAH7031149.1 hypothetical protein B0I36DRAFT_362888 [Microdochium trichocladiopsis]
MAPLPAPYNRHQQPLQAFPPAGFHGNPGLPVPPQSRPWAYAKLVLHTCAFVAAAAVFGLTCSYLAYSVARSAIHVINLPVSIAAMAWTLGNVITFTVCNKGIRVGRNFQEGVHPGANVGLHLVLWMAWVLALVITAFTGESIQNAYDRCVNASKEDDTFYGYNSDYSYYCRGSYQGKEDRMIGSDIPRLRAMLIFCIVALVLHFALFVGACVDTHMRNRNKRARIIYVAAPPPMMVPPPQGGWNQHFPAPPPPGMVFPMAPMQQQAYGSPQPGAYHFPGQPQQQQQQQQTQTHHGEKTAASNPSPMMAGYYTPAPPAPVARHPQPTQPQIPLGGYYAPSGPTHANSQ